MVLSKTEIKHIRIWLRKKDDMFHHKDEDCPFPSYCHKHGKTCKALFPKLKIRNMWSLTNGFIPAEDYTCPCTQFGLAYVVKRVKKMLRPMMGDTD
jgi:hypothetical protein